MGRKLRGFRYPMPPCVDLISALRQISAQATRNTVPVPRHWSNKRKYLQGKRGIEKPPFDLPDFIKRTGMLCDTSGGVRGRIGEHTTKSLN